MYSADLGTWQDRVEAAAPGKNTIVTQRRRPLILGAVPRAGTACAAKGVEVRGMHPFTKTFPVQPDCTFVASGFPWLHGAVDVRKLGDSEASWKQVRVRAGHLDPEPVCLGGDCGSDWARTAIHVSVVDAANVLAQSPAVVEATSANGARWSCETSGGTCLLAPLPMQRRFTVTARLGTRTGETAVNVASGVYDVLVALK